MEAKTVQAYQMFVGGKWIPSHSGRVYPVYNPAQGSAMAEVPRGDARDVAFAIGSARAAFAEPSWRGMDPSKRGRILYKIGQTVREKIEELARMKTEHDVGWPERALRHSLRKDDDFWQCRQISSLPVSFACHQLACHPAGLRLRRAQPCAAQLLLSLFLLGPCACCPLSFNPVSAVIWPECHWFLSFGGLIS